MASFESLEKLGFFFFTLGKQIVKDSVAKLKQKF